MSQETDSSNDQTSELQRTVGSPTGKLAEHHWGQCVQSLLLDVLGEHVTRIHLAVRLLELQLFIFLFLLCPQLTDSDMPHPSVASPLDDSERSSGVKKHFAKSVHLNLVAQLTEPNELRAHPHRRHQLHFPRAECHILLRRRRFLED